ncbi:MAG: hypothetical protein ABIG87_02065 [Patescibacteria group bacterium]
MNIITVIPIYRNHFQKPVLFFSAYNFSVGSLVLVPFPKIEKPAIVIASNDLKERKFWLRKNDIKIEKMSNSCELKFLSRKIIEDIQNKAIKINKKPEEILEKLFSKKIICELNQYSPLKINKDDGRPMSIIYQKFVKKITSEFIRKKLKKYLPNKRKGSDDKDKNATHDTIKTIGSIISQTKIKKTSLHTEKHYLANEIRNYFGEIAEKGTGSFSFYLGFFKKIPEAMIYQYWSEVKQSRKSIKNQQKLFWWKIGQYLKKDKK